MNQGPNNTPDVGVEQPFKNPIFIVGCPRSGTTLLQQMLDAHPDVAIAPETHFMKSFWNKQAKYGDLTQDGNYQQLIRDITALPEFAEMDLSPQVFSDAAWRSQRSYAALFHLLLAQFAQARGVSIVGEKTPGHVMYLPTLKQFFPSAQFVNIVRDPRAVVNSWRSVPWSDCIKGDSEVWRRNVFAARRWTSQFPASMFTLHYERLVAAPEENLRSLCRFLDLEFTSEMLNYHKQEKTVVNVEREPWKARSVESISQDPLTRWKSELSEQTITEIETVVWPEMRRLGYQTQTPLFRLLPQVFSTSIRRRFKYAAMGIDHYFNKVKGLANNGQLLNSVTSKLKRSLKLN